MGTKLGKKGMQFLRCSHYYYSKEDNQEYGSYYLHEKRWTTPFQLPTEPQKSLRAVVVLTLRRLDFLRPLHKIFLAGERNGNSQITCHLCPQVWALPDAKHRPE